MRKIPVKRWETRRRDLRDDAEKPFWISFSDLMTALMVLFLVALSAQLHELSKQRVAADRQRDQAITVQRELELERGNLEVLVAEIGRRETERDSRRELRTAQVDTVLDEIEKVARAQEGVAFDRVRGVIDFGGRALFRHGSHELSVEQANTIRHLVRALLPIKRSEVGERWLKQIVAEGFADQTGAYLYNLNLSLQRSQRVLCVLLAENGGQIGGITGATPAPPAGGNGWAPVPAGTPTLLGGRRRGRGRGHRAPAPTVPAQPQPQPQFQLQPQVQVQSQSLLSSINAEDQALIKRLFLVGGYSSNSAKSSLDESRRIQLRIEFYQLDEKVERKETPLLDTGRCALPG
jgi:outer membrane protein OmpA-like peptidoglycan-associated protein